MKLSDFFFFSLYMTCTVIYSMPYFFSMQTMILQLNDNVFSGLHQMIKKDVQKR